MAGQSESSIHTTAEPEGCRGSSPGSLSRLLPMSTPNMMINAVGHGGKKTMFKALASPSVWLLGVFGTVTAPGAIGDLRPQCRV